MSFGKQQVAVCLPAMIFVGLTKPAYEPSVLLAICFLGLLLGILLGQDPKRLETARWIVILPLLSLLGSFITYLNVCRFACAIGTIAGYNAEANEYTVIIFSSAPALASVSYVLGLLLARLRRLPKV